jgi:hypothetical protein
MAGDSAKKILPATVVSPTAPHDPQELLVVRTNIAKQGIQPPPPTTGQIGQGITLPGAAVESRRQPPAPQRQQLSHLEDDDISTFFKNRRVIVQGSFGMSMFTKSLVTFFILLTAFIASWNYVSPLRPMVQDWAFETLRFSPAAYIPVWTKKAKIFKKRSLSVDQWVKPDAMARDSRIGASLAGPIDPMFQSVVFGYWPQVEAFTQARCPRWQATHECAVRAWYLAYRGIKAPLRAVVTLDVEKLPARDRIFFSYATAMVLDGPQGSVLLSRTQELAKSDAVVGPMIFDARLKYLIQNGTANAVQDFIQRMPETGVSTGELSKWRALQYVVSRSLDKRPFGDSAQPTRALFVSLQKFPGVFKSDPVAFAKVAPVALSLGLVKPIVNIASSAFADASKSPMDSGLRRDMGVLLARALMLDGQLPLASERLKMAQKLDGSDAVTNHILGAIALESRSRERIKEASVYFDQALKGQDRWESHFGRLLSLIRGGHLKDAERAATILRSRMNKDNEMWILLAISEYKLAAAKEASEDLTKSILRQQVRILAGIYDRNPWSTWAGRLYVEALKRSGQSALAATIAAKMDDVSSKTSYLSSAEFMLSPTGPFALMR